MIKNIISKDILTHFLFKIIEYDRIKPTRCCSCFTIDPFVNAYTLYIFETMRFFIEIKIKDNIRILNISERMKTRGRSFSTDGQLSTLS